MLFFREKSLFFFWDNKLTLIMYEVGPARRARASSAAWTQHADGVIKRSA